MINIINLKTQIYDFIHGETAQFVRGVRNPHK